MIVPPGAPDPRLRQLLSTYPPDFFSDHLYRTCEWLDRYATALAFEIATRLELLPRDDSTVDVPSAITRLGYVPGFAPAASWLLEMLAAAGAVSGERDTTGMRRYRRSSETPPGTAELRAAILDHDPEARPTLDLYDAAAAAYPAVARGEATGETALLGPATSGLWLRYFDNRNEAYGICNRVAAQAAASRFSTSASDGEPLNVLEIGGGVGGGGAALIAALTAGERPLSIGRYDFTEPSPFFRRRGERLLRQLFPTVPLAASELDMTRPWGPQGAPDEHYHLVYAVNVLHVAPELEPVLEAARRALRPGGLLVAGECMPLFEDQPVAAEIVFRLFDGFNAGRASASRPRSGFLGPEIWRQQFTGAGFEAVSIEPDLDRLRHYYPRFFAGAAVGRRPWDAAA